jgi:ribosomal protein S18 acetylase RimI-like enzyme
MVDDMQNTGESLAALRIAVADPLDAGVVCTMVRELAAHEGSLDSVTSDEQRWREMLADPDVTVLVASMDGEPVGFVSAVRRLHLWSGREIVALDDLYVRAGARDRGIGAALLRALAGRSGERVIRWEVDEANLAGQRFYLRLGAKLRRKVIARWDPTDGDRRAARPTS